MAVTHQQGVHIFQVGQPASDVLAAIAQDGNPAPMVKRFQGADGVTDVVNVGHPLTPSGQTAMVMGEKVTDTATFEITANPGDRFSLATMLICTNDGFLGLDSVELPRFGEFQLDAYDAGREENTEMSTDLVDPCTALGPEALPGDPNGNVDDDVATTPAGTIAAHPGITGNGDLSVQQHGWDDPVARVTIEVMAGPAATPGASPVALNTLASH